MSVLVSIQCAISPTLHDGYDRYDVAEALVEAVRKIEQGERSGKVLLEEGQCIGTWHVTGAGETW